MKGRLTTVLSLSGVLFAGSAAALVNTEVLRRSDSSNGFGSEISVAMVPAASTTVLEATSQVPPSTLPAVPAASVAPVATQATYKIGDAGLVTLDTGGGVLTVVTAVPSTGWSVVSVESVDASNIEVKLQDGATVVAFRANLLFGVLGTSVESEAVDGEGDDDSDDDSDDSSGGGSTVTTPTTVRSTSTTGTSPPATTGTTGTTATAAPPATTDDHDDDDSGDGGDSHDGDSHDGAGDSHDDDSHDDDDD